MEFIDGIDLEDIEGLKAAGYDIREVCTKLIRSYIKQWAEDQFFQADPHPGNVRIRDGQRTDGQGNRVPASLHACDPEE